MTQPEQEAREMLAAVILDHLPHTWRDEDDLRTEAFVTGLTDALVAFAARPTAGIDREVARMREIANDWRRPALAQVEGPNDLKIYGGTIADDIDRWADMLEAAAKTGERGAWRPISTAPKDGTEFQAWILRGRHGFWEPRCRINTDSEAFEIYDRVDYDMDGFDSYPDLTPTHWQPLPDAPIVGEG